MNDLKEIRTEQNVSFQVEDKVSDVNLHCNGVVVDVHPDDRDYPITADMGEHGFAYYTKDGKYLSSDKEPSLIKI